MKLLVKSILGVIAAAVFIGSVSAETIRPRHAYDDDWEQRVLRFTQERPQDELTH